MTSDSLFTFQNLNWENYHDKCFGYFLLRLYALSTNRLQVSEEFLTQLPSLKQDAQRGPEFCRESALSALGAFYSWNLRVPSFIRYPALESLMPMFVPGPDTPLPIAEHQLDVILQEDFMDLPEFKPFLSAYTPALTGFQPLVSAPAPPALAQQ